MKKQILLIILTWMMPTSLMFGQTYSALWQQVRNAENKDLPQTEMEVLQRIAEKADHERAYGQLLKAGLSLARVACTVSPDSLAPAVRRMEQREQQANDDALRAVYDAVLGRVYADNPSLADDAEERSADYYQKAMTHPALLAQTKARDYEPLVVGGRDSHYFGDDLLSLVAYETGLYRIAHNYYLTTGNRKAQLFTALEMLRTEREETQRFILRLDSLISRYADLPEAGEAAILRHEVMGSTDAKVADRIAYIDEALTRWSAWQRIDVLRNARNELTQPLFTAQVDNEVFIPQREQTVRLTSLRGITELTMRVYRAKIQGDTPWRHTIEQHYKELKPLLTALPELTQTRRYEGRKDYEVFEDSLVLPGLPVGIYLIEISSAPETTVSRQLYFVSNLRVLRQTLPNHRLRIVAVNATTGQPVRGAQIRITSNDHPKKNSVTVTADTQGEYLYDTENTRSCEVYAYTAEDKACPPSDQWNSYSLPRAQKLLEQCAVYTDRAIYRPGQTVHVGAVLYQVEDGYRHKAVAQKEMTIILRDANWQEVGKKKVVTDRFGTCTADFVLPRQGLSGQYSVHVGNYNSYFRVEEYKRPTFQVEFEKTECSYAEGDTVMAHATARSYAGVPVAGARVNYKVVRRRAFWWTSYWATHTIRNYGPSGIIVRTLDEEEVAQGETVTGSDGTFSVAMPLVLPKTPYPMFYQFVVNADVTDQGGETHQGLLSLPLGNRKTALSTTLPSQVQREQLPQVTFHLLNAAGNDVEATVGYQIDNGKWQEAKTNEPLSIISSSLKSGEHTLRATCQEDTLEQTFVVFSENDKRPATQTDDWFWASASQFPDDGHPVTVQVGSSAKDVHIVYTIFDSNGNIVESGAADKSNELINRKLNYQESYGNGLTLAFAWMKEGRCYQHTHLLQRPLPDKQLRLKWETFRDRLTPGQKEEWTLSIVQPDGKPTEAQLMATLYDKSLDQIQRHDWTLKPTVYLPMLNMGWGRNNWGSLFWHGASPLRTINVKALDFSHFNHECYPVGWRLMRTVRVAGLHAPARLMAKQASTNSAVLTEASMAADEAKTADVEAVAAYGANDRGPAEEQVQMRENLQETAFFYPQLQADAEGRVVLKFTLPESLTTWRFLGVAHTADMMYGTLQSEAVAQKDVMIQPNMPRFLRQGDQAALSARLFNTSDKSVSGTARLQLIDPETDAIVYDQQKEILVEGNGSSSVTFPFSPVTDSNPLLICKWTVVGDGFSDGEQHYLPVLPNRERVTVTVPFTQNEPGTKEIDLTQMIPAGATKPQLTIEYTNNPVWLMIQALPTMGQPSDDNAVSQAASLYTNLLGRHLIGQNPNVRTVFEQWTRETTQETSLQSNLQKDQKLKDLLLNETPWVLDAQHESEQKQLLCGFFDESQLQHRITSATDKLGKLQNGDGSWSWWQGMRGSSYMTISVSEMLVRLNQMVGPQSETEPMLKRAFGFLGKEMVELVKEMKKQEKKGVRQAFPGHQALEWLYICALDGRTLPGDVQSANLYLKNLLKKEVKNQTIYEKALTAIVLNDNLYTKSLKEWTVYKEETGRYYDTPRASYSWRNYRIPTQVAAIEALGRLTPDDCQTIGEMQRWLLQEKRTQAWDTPLNSVDAIYAFFNGSPLSTLHAPLSTLHTAHSTLRIDGQPIETSRATAGIGYVKAAIPLQEAKTFSAEKTSAGTSWGAVYAQFMQPSSQIADQASGLSIRREVLPVKGAADTPLHVGDRVKVRITIVADRDYDFVQVVDKRAACLEPVNQLSGYRSSYYCTPKDCTTNYYFDMMPKGKHVVETEYYIDREGLYETGTCTAGCAYSPEFRGTTPSQTITITPKE